MTSSEHDQLRDAVRSFLARQATARSRTPGELDRPLWTRLAGELSLTALVVDATPVELAIALEETGRALVALPYRSTVVAAAVCDDAAEGSTIAAVELGGDLTAADGRLDGELAAVADGDVADLLVVAAATGDGPALFAVRPTDAGVEREPVVTLDQTRPAARVRLHHAPAQRLDAPVPLAREALDRALAAESIGAAAANLTQTVEYLKTRRQFGQALASFQALRHRVASLYAQLEAATSSAWYAARAPEAEQPVAAPVAALVAIEAAYAIAADAIQLHGGIGFTWEHDAHRFFKRATVNRLAYGDPVRRRRHIAELAGLR